jgi:hypothetical protein
VRLDLLKASTGGGKTADGRNVSVASSADVTGISLVKALHLKLDGLLAKGDVILAHSDCGIDP